MKKIYEALFNFQQEVPPIRKNSKGYGYHYADLDHILNICRPIMKKYTLGYTQTMEGRSLITTLFHVESGEEIKSSLKIPEGVSLKGMNEFQVLGSGITYIRRYCLAAILGISTEDDIDGAAKEPDQKPLPDKKPLPSRQPAKEPAKQPAKKAEKENQKLALLDKAQNPTEQYREILKYHNEKPLTLAKMKAKYEVTLVDQAILAKMGIK